MRTLTDVTFFSTHARYLHSATSLGPLLHLYTDPNAINIDDKCPLYESL